MGIRARLTVITAEAQAAADRVYNKYESRDSAILNQVYADIVEGNERDKLKAKYNLTEADLTSIIEEYLHFQHVGVR